MKGANLLRLVAAIGILGIGMSACAPNKPYRVKDNVKNNSCNSILDSNGKQACPDCIMECEDGYGLYFIEFTERGNVFKDSLKDEVINAIEKETKNERSIIIVFIHGWKHNANSEDGNVKSFRKVLARIADSRYRESILGGRRVIGVYIGWRGLSFSVNPLINLTYWDRKAVSQEVGKGGVTDVLLDLEKISERNDDNIFLTVGHSLGGSIILSALDEVLLERLIATQYDSVSKPNYFGNGVVILNPAIEANQIFPLWEKSRNIGGQGFGSEQKFLHVITSKDDKATGWVFWAGQALDVGLTWNQEELERSYKDTGTISEFDLDTTTIGKFKPFHTGNLIDSPPRNEGEMGADSKQPRPGEVLKHWRYIDCCDDWESCRLSNDADYHLACNRLDPISFIYTTGTFIENHNDIFNDNVIAYIGTIISESLYLMSPESFEDGIYQDCVSEDGTQFLFGDCYNVYYDRLKNDALQ